MGECEMTLKCISYEEFSGEPREWRLEKVALNPEATLIVGKNSTGKSRFLSIIGNLAASISGKKSPMDGNFSIEVELPTGHYEYELVVVKRQVQREKLVVDGRTVLDRHSDRPGPLHFEKQGEAIESQFQPSNLAVATRQDQIQHPWFVELATWAGRARSYSFATGFQRERVATVADAVKQSENTISANNLDPNDAVGTYLRGFSRFGEKFDEVIVSDMRALGFEISEVGADSVQALIPEVAFDAVMLFIREDGLNAKIPQALMSQGLFRTLALVISLNAQVLADDGRFVLIDDVGEGLDFERSSALIQLLLKKSRDHSIQILMATNDRFVMNGVPINQWCILERTKSVVHAYTAQTHKAVFDDFKYIGLSNFDFFRTRAYSEKLDAE